LLLGVERTPGARLPVDRLHPDLHDRPRDHAGVAGARGRVDADRGLRQERGRPGLQVASSISACPSSVSTESQLTPDRRLRALLHGLVVQPRLALRGLVALPVTWAE